MQMIELWGKRYYSSFRHHYDYLERSDAHARYRLHKDFIRLLRSIDAWDLYLEQGEALELRWMKGGKVSSAKPALVNDINNLPPLLRLMFKANGYRPLIFLTASAQHALFERLPDTLSKQVSVAKNVYVAREQQQDARKPSALFPVEAADRQLKSYLSIAGQLGTPLHIAQQIAAREIKRDTGIDLTPMLISAPAQQAVIEEEMMLEPSLLAKKFGFRDDGRHVNRLLERVGWQIRLVSGEWEATPVGKLYSIPHPWVKPEKTGYNLKWKVEEVRKVFRDHGFLPGQQESENI